MRTTALVLLMLAAGCHAASPPPPTALPADSAQRGMMTHRGGGMRGMHADSAHPGMMMHGGAGMGMHADSGHPGMMMHGGSGMGMHADSAHRGMMMPAGGGMRGMHADSGHRGMMMMPAGGRMRGMHADSAHRGMMPPGPMRHGAQGAHAGTEAAEPRGDAPRAAQQCPASTPALVERGRAVFGGRGNCAACHGTNAHGTFMAPNLTDADWLHGDGSYPWLADLIATGVARPLRHPAPMPPRGGADLSAAEVCAVAAYVRSRAG
jgi:hypothetical protein